MKLFVYGTLKDRAIKSGGVPAKIKGTLYDVGPFPAIKLTGLGDVHGVCFDVDARDLIELDRYEGTPTLYTREETDVEMENGEKVTAFVYVWARSPSDLPIIESGVW